MLERVPKLDGFQMPPPRPNTNGATSDVDMNAMFKSVLHRSIPWFDIDKKTSMDPVALFACLHARPDIELPQWPWSPAAAFSSSW